MRINVDFDTRAVLRDLRVRVPDIARKAQITAVNKTAGKIQTQFRRELSAVTGIKQKEFKSQVKLFRATARNRRARVWFGMRRGIRLKRLVNSPTSKFDDLARGTLHGRSGADAFQATVNTGSGNSGQATGFFVRKGRGRLPISQVRVRFDDNDIAPGALNRAGDRVGPEEYRAQFSRDMNRRLRNTASAARRGRSRR